MTASTPTAQSVLDFWFSGETTLKGWFTQSAPFDASIKENYTALVAAARAGKLDSSWTSDAHSTLALLLCLDQFPRNMFRGTPEAFSSDGQAREVAAMAIAKGFDREVSLVQAAFFYIPFEHGEDVVSQTASVALFEGLVGRVEEMVKKGGDGLGEEEVRFPRYGLRAALEHRNVISKFGRFPGRNVALGRQSTPEEVKHLEEHGSW